jgi:hypothetical protein
MPRHWSKLRLGPVNGGCGRTGPCSTPTPHRAAGASLDGRLHRCEWHPIGNTGGLKPRRLSRSSDRQCFCEPFLPGPSCIEKVELAVRFLRFPRQPVARWKREPSLSCQVPRAGRNVRRVVQVSIRVRRRRSCRALRRLLLQPHAPQIRQSQSLGLGRRSAGAPQLPLASAQQTRARKRRRVCTRRLFDPI